MGLALVDHREIVFACRKIQFLFSGGGRPNERKPTSTWGYAPQTRGTYRHSEDLKPRDTKITVSPRDRGLNKRAKTLTRGYATRFTEYYLLIAGSPLTSNSHYNKDRAE